MFDPHEPARPTAPRNLETARAIRLGCTRMLLHMGFASLFEVGLAINRRVDIMAVDSQGSLIIVEVKSSLADFRSDQKWHEYLDYCDRFYFAVDENFPAEILPDDQGLIIADRYGAEIIRPAEAVKLATSRRNALLRKFGFLAARRMCAVEISAELDGEPATPDINDVKL